jgi:hypothetical protein
MVSILPKPLDSSSWPFFFQGFHYTTTIFDFPPKLKLLVKSVDDGHITIENKDLKNDWKAQLTSQKWSFP